MKFLDLESANALLSRVRIIVRGNKLYLRATLPNKNGKGNKQQDIRTGLSNTPKDLKIALLRAQRIENDLNLEKFNWADWIDILPDNQMTIKEAIARYEIFYWETRKRTPAREDDYINTYQRFFDYLPEKEILTGELLRKHLVSFEVDTYYRMRCHLAYSAIAKWANIELPKDWRFLKGKYKVKRDRKIPSDAEIPLIWDSINNDAWRWIFGMLAVYGLRPHEIFHLDLTKFPVIRTQKETKTGVRLIYPLSPQGQDWVREFDLKHRVFPHISTEGKTNQDLGAKISGGFYERKLGVTPYALRDAYAIRGAKLGIDSLMMSKWMGHSVQVHSDHYLSYIDEMAMEAVWQRSRGELSLRAIPNSREDIGKEKLE